MDKLRQYYKNAYKIVIMSNQKGSYSGKGSFTFEDFQKRWFNIQKLLNVPVYILAAPLDDLNRKPIYGMWEFMEKNLNDNLKINYKNSFYVGDACGRPKDHSDCDIKFAINCGLNFKTPEEFFEDSTKFPFEELKQKLRGFNPKKYLENFNEKENQTNIIENNLKSWKDIKDVLEGNFENIKVRLIILVGSPASGKTTLTKKILDLNSSCKAPRTWNIYSLDKEGSKKKMTNKLSIVLKESSKCCIIDATNGKLEMRNEWIKIAKDISQDIDVVCIHINIEKEITLHLNDLRGLKKNINPDYEFKEVPKVAIHTFWKHFIQPTKDENFSSIIKLDFEPIFENETDKKLFEIMF
jgi:bifunctional polynucleotide phosphatase/kinase